MKLTKAEEQVMQILWKIEKGFIKDILEHFGYPKPAYTTIATIVKILGKKGFVNFRPYGNAYQYFPLISRNRYARAHINPVFKHYFKNSLTEVVSFYIDNNKVKTKEIDETIKVLNHLKKQKK